MSAKQATHFGRPSSIAIPFKWHGTARFNSVTNVGFQRGTMAEPLIEHAKATVLSVDHPKSRMDGGRLRCVGHVSNVLEFFGFRAQ